MQFKIIVAAIDIDDDLAQDVLNAAYSLAQKDEAELRVACVWPPLSIVAPAFSAEIAANASEISQASIEQHKKGREKGRERLAEMAAKFAPGAQTVMLDGEAAEETARFAAETGADLIVTGSHQRKFWDTLFQGSASRDLVRDAPCAVLLVTKAFAAKLDAENQRGA